MGTFVIRRCQELGVPLTVLEAHLSDVGGLTRGAIDAMSQYGGHLGLRGANEVKQEVEWVFKQVCLDSSHPDRRIPLSCDRAWFADRFCGGKMDKLGPDKSPWAHVTSFRVDLP